jgi:Zn-dependent metalloprotease
MRAVLLFSYLFLLFTNLNAQALLDQESVKYANWASIEEAPSTNPIDFVKSNKEDFGLSANEHLELINESRDALGITHYKFQQYHQNVPIEGAEYLLHVSQDKVWANGRLVYGCEDGAQPGISEDQALLNALAYFDADRYFWEDEEKEQMIKRIKQDPNASFYPEGKLLYSDKNYSQDGQKYRLVWKFEIYGYNEKLYQDVYVDANTGEIDHVISGVCTEASEGTAITRYSGEQSIISDSIQADLYHLVDDTRGGGIETYNLQEETAFETAVHFTDEDNYWDNDNAAMDNGATDLHWGAEMTYDYYLTQHGRNSFDANGAPIVTYAHYGNGYSNAAWVGYYGFFGDGDDNPWTSIDIVGHEITHGVTKTSASLIYYYESGALNESFSDIFGTNVEFYAIPDSANWQNGLLNFIIRDMADPNAYDCPDTYLGDYWLTGSGDYGGVHTNSGVQNFWYYLLVEGGSGVNDNGDSYSVEGLGFDVASAITYRNLTVYLTSTSTYFDARQGSIQSAIDLYGECSNEVQQVLNAWHAVGIGSDNYNADLEMVDILSPSNSCGLGEEETVILSFRLNNSGCSTAIPSGASIDLSYRLDEGDLITETLVLSDDMVAGDVISYEFLQSVTLPEIAEEYELDVFIDYEGDDFNANNSILDKEIERKFDHGNVNMGFESLIHSPDSFYVQTGKHAQAKISSQAENTGNRGFMMTALFTSGYLSDFADDPANNFEQNHEYISRICFCVDAQNWENVKVKFDMKQTHSMLYMENWGNDSTEFASSLRLLVNGQQIGDQFHPDDYSEDPYLTYNYELDSLAGTYFEFCFESKNYINSNNDNVEGSEGDNTYLDNVLFYEEGVNAVSEIALYEPSVYPNPSTGVVYIQVAKIGNTGIEVIDTQGRKVYSADISQKQVNRIDLSYLNSGLYTLIITSDNERFTRKLTIN